MQAQAIPPSAAALALPSVNDRASRAGLVKIGRRHSQVSESTALRICLTNHPPNGWLGSDSAKLLRAKAFLLRCAHSDKTTSGLIYVYILTNVNYKNVCITPNVRIPILRGIPKF